MLLTKAVSGIPIVCGLMLVGSCTLVTATEPKASDSEVVAEYAERDQVSGETEAEGPIASADPASVEWHRVTLSGEVAGVHPLSAYVEAIWNDKSSLLETLRVNINGEIRDIAVSEFKQFSNLDLTAIRMSVWPQERGGSIILWIPFLDSEKREWEYNHFVRAECFPDGRVEVTEFQQSLP